MGYSYTLNETSVLLHLCISSLTSEKSSKLDVSSIERTSTGMAAGRSRMWSQYTPRKKGASFNSSMPLCEPKRHSASQQNRTIVSFASSEIGTSSGNVVSRQFITLWYVSWGFSLQNGGYPAERKYSVSTHLTHCHITASIYFAQI